MRTTYTTLGNEATPSTERSTSPGNLHRRPSLLSAGPWVGGHLCSEGHPGDCPLERRRREGREKISRLLAFLLFVRKSTSFGGWGRLLILNAVNISSGLC